MKASFRLTRDGDGRLQKPSLRFSFPVCLPLGFSSIRAAFHLFGHAPHHVDLRLGSLLHLRYRLRDASKLPLSVAFKIRFFPCFFTIAADLNASLRVNPIFMLGVKYEMGNLSFCHEFRSHARRFPPWRAEMPPSNGLRKDISCGDSLSDASFINAFADFVDSRHCFQDLDIHQHRRIDDDRTSIPSFDTTPTAASQDARSFHMSESARFAGGIPIPSDSAPVIHECASAARNPVLDIFINDNFADYVRQSDTQNLFDADRHTSSKRGPRSLVCCSSHDSEREWKLEKERAARHYSSGSLSCSGHGHGSSSSSSVVPGHLVKQQKNGRATIPWRADVLGAGGFLVGARLTAKTHLSISEETHLKLNWSLGASEASSINDIASPFLQLEKVSLAFRRASASGRSASQCFVGCSSDGETVDGFPSGDWPQPMWNKEGRPGFEQCAHSDGV